MTKKIENTFAKALEQVETLQKVFRQNGKLESAMMENNSDVTSLAEINSAFETLKQALATSTTLTEGVLDADDDDGFMARSQLYFMARDAIQLHGIIGDTDDLEPWVQSKIAQAAQGMDAVRRYTEYNAMKQEMPGNDEQELMASNTPNMDKEIAAFYKQLKLPAGGFGGKLKAESLQEAFDLAEANDFTAIDALLENLSEEQIATLFSIDEGLAGKLGKYALAAMLGLGAVKGIDSTSAKHSPLGQALDHASQTWSGEEAAQALELYKNIDLYADEGHGALRHWASQNQDLINQFKESAVNESGLEDDIIDAAKKMDLDAFVAQAAKFGMSDKDAYAFWDELNLGAGEEMDPFGDDAYDEYGVRTTSSFNMPPKNEGSYGKKKKKKKYYDEDIALPRRNGKGGSIYDMPKRTSGGSGLLDIKDANGVTKYIPLDTDGEVGGGIVPNPDYTLAPGEKFDIERDQIDTHDFKTGKNPHMKPGLPSIGKPLRKKKDFIATEDSYQDRYNRAKATANDIKVNRELATMPQDAARKVSGNADYSHDSNPAYAAKKAARKDGIPHKDIVTRMKPNPTDGKFKWGRDQLSDDVNEAEEKPYICVHAKKGKHECHASSSYEAAKKAAAHWKMKSTAGIDAHLAVEEDVASYEDQYDDRIQVTVEKDKLLINGNPAQNYDWNSSAKDMVNPKFYARAKSWKELHGYLVRFMGNEEGMKNAIRQVFNTNEGNITVSEGMNFDDKRNDDLQTVAKDLFANAKAQAKKRVK